MFNEINYMYSVRETSEWIYSIDKLNQNWELVNIEWSNLKFHNLNKDQVQLLVDEVIHDVKMKINSWWNSSSTWPWEWPEESEIVRKVKELYSQKFWSIIEYEDWLDLDFSDEFSWDEFDTYKLQEWLNEVSEEEVKDCIELWEKFLPWKKLTILWSTWEGWSWKVMKVVDEEWNKYALKRIPEEKIQYNDPDEISMQNFFADHWISPRIYTWRNWEILQTIENWNWWLLMEFVDNSIEVDSDEQTHNLTIEKLEKIKDVIREFHKVSSWIKWLRDYREVWWYVDDFSNMMEELVDDEILSEFYTEENKKFMRYFMKEARRLEQEYPRWVINWDSHPRNFLFNEEWKCYSIDYPDVSYYSKIIDAWVLARDFLWFDKPEDQELVKATRTLLWNDEKSMNDAALWWFYMFCRYRASSLNVATKKFRNWEMSLEDYRKKIQSNIELINWTKELYRKDLIMTNKNLEILS